MAAPQSSRTSNRSTSTGPGIHSPGAAAASFYRASSGYGARSSSYTSSPSCPHHHQHQYHATTASTTHRHHGSSSSPSFSSHHYYPPSASAFASSTSSSFLSSSTSRSAVPGLFHHHDLHITTHRHASPTRVNLVTGGVASSGPAAPSVRFSIDSRSISPHNRGPIAVAPSGRRDPHPHQHPHHHYHHNHHSHHHPHPHLHHPVHHQHQHHAHHHHHQISTGGRPVPSGAHGAQHGHTQPRRTCMCSPTTHPGSFRCSLHKAAAAASFGGGGGGTGSSYSSPSNRLNARRSAMTNSLVRIGTVEGDLVRRALAALIRPSSHQLRRRAAFQPRPSRLSVTSFAGDDQLCAAAA